MAMVKKVRSLPISHFFSAAAAAAAPSLLRSARSLQTLAYEEIIAAPDAPFTSTAFVLHGLLGTGRNWRSFARDLATDLRAESSYFCNWRMILVDLRNHGKSAEIEGLEIPHNMANSAKDLANLVKVQGWGWPEVVIGHSMGGKVAMDFAQSCAGGRFGDTALSPKQVWVLDSVPVEVNQEGDNEVEKVLQTLQNLPPHFTSRKWVVDHMLQLGFSKSLSEWIASNLKKSGEEWTWSFNLQGCIEMFKSYRETCYRSFLQHPPKGMEVAFVQAEKSDRWSPSLVEELKRLSGQDHGDREGNFTFHVLPNAGHWVHVDNPEELQQIMLPNILSIS